MSWPRGSSPITSPERTRSSRSYESFVDRAGGIPRLEFRIRRLRAAFRVTYAFHAREVRFERDAGDGFEPAFPETFSFHADRHDPAELYLRFEDLWTNPGRLAPGANRRDGEESVLRLIEALPRYLEDSLDRLVERDDEPALLRASEDVAVFVQIVQRFVDDKDLAERSRLRMTRFHLRKLLLRALTCLLEARVSPEYMEGIRKGEHVSRPSPDPHDLGFFYALAEEDAEHIDHTLSAATEAAYYEWLEGVCLEEGNGAFESEGSPFDDREVEVLRAVSRDGQSDPIRPRDMSPFLCRPGHRDCLRLLKKLETWFLRQYDVRHAAGIIHHGSILRVGPSEPSRLLSRLSSRSLGAALGFGALPFVLGAFFYDLAPQLFDWWASGLVGLVVAGAAWFLVYRFIVRKDLTFFHASVPRIGAGIIVGYLPVFLIDEVWDLAEQSLFYIVVVISLLGLTTLLYIYVEVHRRLGDPGVAFQRTLGLFLLGISEAAAFGILVTSLLGPLMAARNWGSGLAEASLPALREGLPPFVGALPKIIGIEWLPAFPTAVLLMTFLSFFIGTFLQLLWEDLPITEPL